MLEKSISKKKIEVQDRVTISKLEIFTNYYTQGPKIDMFRSYGPFVTIPFRQVKRERKSLDLLDFESHGTSLDLRYILTLTFHSYVNFSVNKSTK